MENEQPEPQFIKEILTKLNSTNSDWVDGDLENLENKTADIVNHERKVAIEVKDDFSDPLIISTLNDMKVTTRDMGVLSNRYKNDIEKANKKFQNYPTEYKTMVFIRSNRVRETTLSYILGGLIRLTQNGRIPNTKKNITQRSERVSIYAFLNTTFNEVYYYRNPKSNIEFEDVESIIKRMGYTPKEIGKDSLFSYDGLSI